MTTSHPHSDDSQSDEVKTQKAQAGQSQPNNPLHGVTLLKMLEHLVEVYGWEELGHRIDIRCFTHDPSFKSSLKFLRKTEWARAKVERLYLRSLYFNHQPTKPAKVEAESTAKAKFKWGKVSTTDTQQASEGKSKHD